MLTEDQIEAMARANWPGIEWDDESLAESAHLREAFRAGVRAVIAAHEAKAEPFGYFRAEPLGWTDCAATDEGAIALYERPAAPPVPEALTKWANSPELVETGNQWQQWYEHARSWVHVQLSCSSSHTSQPAVPQGVIYEKADSLYKRGYTDRQNGKDYDPRGCDEWQEVVDWLTPAAPSQPVTYRVDDEAQLLTAIAVMNDVLADIGDWEDQALADAVRNSKRDLEAMAQSIRFMAGEPSQPVTLTDRQFDLICQAIDKADTITMEGDYMMDSGDCIAVVRVMQALFDIAALREKE